MTFVTKKHLHRRTLLRGAGAAISLPLLDAMLPAASPAPVEVRRIGFVYVPNGIIMNEWMPATTGADFDMKRVLKPMEPFKRDITVLSGLYNHAAKDVQGGAHAKASGSFLSGKPPKHTAGADVHSGITFDQIAANHWASETRVPSLQLGCEDSRMVGNCDTGSSCAYTNTLSWKDADTPLMVEVNPRSVFERLFGNVDMSLSSEVRARRALYRKSILDETQQNAQSLVADLGAADKRKLDQYLTAIREVEQRIIDSEQNPLVPSIDKPAGIPFVFSDYVKLMFDLQVVAFQSDLSRVSTIMLGREGSVRTYPEIGVPDPHHPLTHHRGHPDFIEKVTKINVFHAELFAYFLQRLKATEEGDGSLLDRSAILYGGALSEGNGHSSENLPLVLAGAAGGLRGGKHIAAEPQPVANLFVDLLNRGGVPTEAFGDSTARLDISA